MMIKNEVRHLLVIDDRNKPIGIITPLEIKGIQPTKTGKLLKQCYIDIWNGSRTGGVDIE